MSHDDLATLLREEVGASEPSHGLDAMVPVRLGRRRLRTRRLASAAAAAVVAAVGAAVAVPLMSGHDDARRALDTAEHDTDHFDAEAMPALLDQHARAVLERSVPDLGPVSFSAWSGSNDGQLPAGRYDEAVEMSVSYGDRDHAWDVTVIHSKGDAEGSLQNDCRTTLRTGDYLDCDVTTTAAGDVVSDPADGLAPLGPERLRRVAHRLSCGAGLRGTAVVRAEREGRQVRDPHRPSHGTREGLLACRGGAAFDVPVADLVELGADPALALPESRTP